MYLHYTKYSYCVIFLSLSLGQQVYILAYMCVCRNVSPRADYFWRFYQRKFVSWTSLAVKYENKTVYSQSVSQINCAARQNVSTFCPLLNCVCCIEGKKSLYVQQYSLLPNTFTTDGFIEKGVYPLKSFYGSLVFVQQTTLIVHKFWDKYLAWTAGKEIHTNLASRLTLLLMKWGLL